MSDQEPILEHEAIDVARHAPDGLNTRRTIRGLLGSRPTLCIPLWTADPCTLNQFCGAREVIEVVRAKSPQW